MGLAYGMSVYVLAHQRFGQLDGAQWMLSDCDIKPYSAALSGNALCMAEELSDNYPLRTSRTHNLPDQILLFVRTQQGGSARPRPQIPWFQAWQLQHLGCRSGMVQGVCQSEQHEWAHDFGVTPVMRSSADALAKLVRCRTFSSLPGAF